MLLRLAYCLGNLAARCSTARTAFLPDSRRLAEVRHVYREHWERLLGHYSGSTEPGDRQNQTAAAKSYGRPSSIDKHVDCTIFCHLL
ncbi:unnamed protein product [Protopolystoma xenopodis]|uniref:Uncharacterized protein n=1 Tax=Protopolystoma xenopodis TaxID=117903 RepID=A0A448WKI8_9PLAT|nr:unnamed protein product [Protopolystoma xenopodis]